MSKTFGQLRVNDRAYYSILLTDIHNHYIFDTALVADIDAINAVVHIASVNK